MSNSTISQDRRPIPGYEGLYEIDRAGNVYALFPFQNRPIGRKMTVRADKGGYIHVCLCKKGQCKTPTVHRLVMLAWCPIEGSDDLDVNHINGDKSNNSLDNLEWATHGDNIRHARSTLNAWRNQRGERAAGVKLTAISVREIRRLKANGVTQSEIAAIYGVTQENISAIIRRKSWAHVK